MFVDEAEITIQGGRGGNGKVAFFRGKAGPSGGMGGKGGDIFMIIDANTPSLKKFIESISFKAENGTPGGLNNREGAMGNDLTLRVPIGTTIIDTVTKSEIVLDRTNPQVRLAKGGRGGLGNMSFKTATNQTPRNAEQGFPGEKRHLILLLKLIADYGLIGLPNAGKSSLLNELTAAHVRTANYPFTTLEPNLGVYNGKVLADIPGLIEGASTGRGLGIKFLKHIEKVKLLLHCISADSNDVLKDYETVLGELGQYKESLLVKEMVILLTKTDLATSEQIKKKIAFLKKTGKKVIPLSIYEKATLTELKKILI